MFDRKPENFLVFHNEYKSTQEFAEVDFDDTENMRNLFGDIINGALKIHWRNRMASNVANFCVLPEFMSDDMHKEWDDLAKNVAENFIFTTTNIEQLLINIAWQNKYFNIPTEKLVKCIEAKFKTWKQMHNNNIVEEILKQYNDEVTKRRCKPLLDAINKTREALSGFLNFDNRAVDNKARILSIIGLADVYKEWYEKIDNGRNGDEKNHKALRPKTVATGNSISAGCSLEDCMRSRLDYTLLS